MHELIHRLIAGFALPLGTGLILWVAANWQAQTRQFKFLLLQALLLLATLALGGLLARQ
jgi:uncharacterized membrane protein